MIRSLICLVLLIHNAAEARDYSVALTTTRAVGDPVSVPIVVMRTPVTAKNVSITIGYEPALCTPVLPGSPITVAGGTVSAALTSVPGEISITFAGTLPTANSVIYSVAFKCIKPGKCQFPIKTVTAKDAAAVAVPMSGDTLDWLVITDSGAVRSAIE